MTDDSDENEHDPPADGAGGEFGLKRRITDRRSSSSAHDRSEVGRLEGLVEVERLQRLLDERTLALSTSNDALDLRDEFLALVSHDLRNPLSAIALNTQLLERLVSSGDPRLTRISRSLAASIAQMQRIISDLLDLAAIQANKLSVQLQRGDLRAPIEAAVESSRSIAAGKSIALDAVVGPEPLTARFDPGRIEQVLENLIHNALKFTPAGGRISVEGKVAGDVVEIRVRDTGPGLQPGEIAVIFERYQQVEKRGRKALGLGLYISRSIVESHGGRIRAESVPGEGSTFLFTLPRAE